MSSEPWGQYPNRETWVAALHVNNSYDDYQRAMRMTRDAIADKQSPPEYLTSDEYVVGLLAERMSTAWDPHERFSRAMIGQDQFTNDLLSGAYDAIEWRIIAREFIDHVREVDDDVA